MLSDNCAGLLKEPVSLRQESRGAIQATVPAHGFEFAERNRDCIHAAVGARAGTVVRDQFDFDMIA